MRLVAANTRQNLEIAAGGAAGGEVFWGRRATGGELAMSVLAQRFADPALGELILAHDALGVDA